MKATKCSNGKLDGPSSQLEPLQGNQASYFMFAVPLFNYSHNKAWSWQLNSIAYSLP